ncbi:MAG: lectin-like protein [Phycisphaerae bacterium]|nr:lectin-like protein [Phycisphaerae bacterium]
MKTIAVITVSVLVLTLLNSAHAAPVQFVGNGHYYEFVSGDITWQNAFTAASGRTWSGASGYLATITTAAEDQFIIGQFATGVSNQFAWIGGHEPADDGVWKWASGPEQGVQFSLGDAATAPFNYANWGGIEPNDFKIGEDYTMMNLGVEFSGISSGQWADAISTPNESDPVVGYIVEYTPEPATMTLLALSGLAVLRRRRRQ